MVNESRRRILRSATASICALPLAGAAAFAAPTELLGAKSRLPYPADADVWVDAEGAPSLPAPGGEGSIVRKVSVLVFRPKGDNLSWNGLTALYVKPALLSADPKVEFTVNSVPPVDPRTPDPSANAEETNVYKSRPPGEYVVLGMIRNVRTRHQLAYAVVLSGKLTTVQALAQAKSVVNELAGRAWMFRVGPPVPPGSIAAAPTVRLRGPQIQQLMRSIESSRVASPRVKAMARAVVPQSTAITLSTWRTPAVLLDRDFFSFYLEQAERLGWGAPISRDETQLNRPTLLFQRPGSDGVIMVRAAPTLPNAIPGITSRPSTTIFVLIMEGPINVAALGAK